MPLDLVVGETSGTSWQDVRNQILALNLTNVNVHKARISMPYGWFLLLAIWEKTLKWPVFYIKLGM